MQLKNIIYDSFIMDGCEYVVLNNRLISDSSLSDKLLIGEVLVVDGVKEVRPLYDEELYDIAADYYLLLKSAYLKEV